jgi:hypothetical protein
MNDKLIVSTAAAIQGYLLSRPESADTLEGIHQWWISGPDNDEAISVTMAALDYLEVAGVLERAQIGRRQVWRRRRSEASPPD